MANSASYAAEPGKRLWAAGFDVLAVLVFFLVVAVAGEGFRLDLASWSVLAGLHFLYHFVALLIRDGRTLGKTAVEICVISASGEKLTLLQCVLRAGVRAAPLPLFDVPDLDLVGALLLLVLVIAEVRLLEHSLTRQTVADRMAHSLVVNLPPLQPHRAPAMPMYSGSDAEFGFPPRRNSRDKDDWKNRSNCSSSGRVSALRAELRRSTWR